MISHFDKLIIDLPKVDATPWEELSATQKRDRISSKTDIEIKKLIDFTLTAKESGDASFEDAFGICMETVIQRYRPFVKKFVKMFKAWSHVKEDLESVALINLWEAFMAWNWTYGTAFTHYLSISLRNRIHREIAVIGFETRVPSHFIERHLILIEQIISDENFELSEFETYLHNNYKEDELSKLDRKILLNLCTSPIDIYNLSEQGIKSKIKPRQIESLELKAEPFIDTNREIFIEQLEAVLGTISDRSVKIIKMRFGMIGGIPFTLDEIGKEIGLTRERIRQIEAKTMSQLRHPSRSGALKDYLDDELNY